MRGEGQEQVHEPQLQFPGVGALRVHRKESLNIGILPELSCRRSESYHSDVNT